MPNPFKKETKELNPLGLALSPLREALGRADINVSPETRKSVMSMEGIQDDIAGTDALHDGLAAALGAAQLSMEGYSEESIKAAMIGLAGAADPTAYNAHAASVNFGNDKAMRIDSVTQYGNLDYGFGAADVMSMEAFNNADLTQVQAFTALWNLGASVQGPCEEMMYRTQALTPDQITVEMRAPLLRLYKGTPRNNAGTTEFNFRNALEAYRDPSVLANDSTKVVPIVDANGKNENLFIDKTLMAPVSKVIEGASVLTAPLRMGASFDLLGLCTNTGLTIDGVTNETDQLDSQIKLEALYVHVIKGTDKSLIRWDTSANTRALFIKSQQGTNVEFRLTFDTQDLGFEKTMTDVAGAAPAALADLFAAGYSLRMQVDVSGKTFLHQGTTRLVAAGEPEVVAVYNAAGVQVALDDATVAPLLAALSFKLEAYDLLARRSNQNKRTRGNLLDRQWVSDYAAMPLSEPLSVVCPLNDEAGDQQALSDLIALTRARTSINANARAHSYIDAGLAWAKVNKDVIAQNGGVAPARISDSLEGISRHLVNPYFKELELDMMKVVQSLHSGAQLGDVNAAMLNFIRVAGNEMVIDSNYMSVLQHFGNGAEKPCLQIATDLNIPQYLMINGDPRSLGPNLDFDIQATQNNQMRDTIILTLGRKQRNGPDFMSFGTHFWMPEVVSVGQVAYQGGNVKQLMVQARNLHVHQTPIAIRIRVKNLNKAVATLMPFKTTEIAP